MYTTANSNSYSAGDKVNSLKWSDLEEESYRQVYEYYKGLIIARVLIVKNAALQTIPDGVVKVGKLRRLGRILLGGHGQPYNVPEGSYSTDPYNGEVRVKEFKQAVKALHDNGISVVMDVVYNHVQDAANFCFNKIVPGYFSRVALPCVRVGILGPSLRIGAVQIQHHGPDTVDAGGPGIGITGLSGRAVDGYGIGIVNPAQISLPGRHPGAVDVGSHLHFLPGEGLLH